MTVGPDAKSGDLSAGTVRGARYGLAMPSHAAALAQAPLPFLDTALRAWGALPPDNAIAAVVGSERCGVGSTGEKLMLEVAHARPDPALATRLFAKFSRNFDDPFHDRRCRELESEIRFYDLARAPDFPIRVPRPLFGDFDPATDTGLLIVEQVPFGSAGIEPLHAKCMDHLLAQPLEHYRAILTALARLAGADRAGRLGERADALFPFDREQAIAEDPITASEAELLAQVDDVAALQREAPALFLAHLRDEAVVARLRACVGAVVRHARDIKACLNARDDLIALTHFNPNIDNAWFWRSGDGALSCGLFDWQRARRMNLACALWGGLCAAGPELWAEHLDDLLAGFADEYVRAGGPQVAPADLRWHLHLYSAFMGVAGLLGAARLVRARMPDVAALSGPRDPRLLADEGARCFLHVFTAFLAFLEMDDFSGRLPGLWT